MAKHTPSQECNCPDPRPIRPWHCAANATDSLDSMMSVQLLSSDWAPILTSLITISPHLSPAARISLHEVLQSLLDQLVPQLAKEQKEAMEAFQALLRYSRITQRGRFK